MTVEKEKSPIEQLLEALNKNNVEALLTLVANNDMLRERTMLDPSEAKPPRIYCESESCREGVTVLGWVACHGTIEMLLGLLNLPNIIIPGGNHRFSSPFTIVVNHRNVTSVPDVWCHPKLINAPFYNGSEFNTPLTYAYYWQDEDIFNALLTSSELDIHAQLSNYERKYSSLHHILFFWDSNKTAVNALLLNYYFNLMIKQPHVVREAFQKHPNLPDALSVHNAQFWKLFQKQVHTSEPEEYLKKLIEVTESEYQDAALQHPLYILFSKRPSIMNSIWASFFSGNNLDYLGQMHDSIRMLDNKNGSQYCVTGEGSSAHL